MRFKLLIPFLFLVLFFSCLCTKAQKITQFANDTNKFVKDLGAYFFDNTVNKEEAAVYIKNFEKFWKENIISGYYKEVSIKTANAMLARKMKPYPFFYSYFSTLVNSIESKKSYDEFENWQGCVEKILKGKSNRGIQEFFEMSESIFKNNMFYKTPSYNYYSVESNYKFEYDSIPKVVFNNITLVGVNPRGDSIAIESTSGVFYPTNGKFVGKGGRVSWARAGLGDEVYATIKRYTIDCKTGNYGSDSATFVGKQFFDKPQTGRVTDRIITENQDKTYPR
ncbi:MAG: hypothetical protein H0W61_14630, partial [Bacteroidetes bacterium]|nr:hypothetical protein [Bacteroidota bacterium]